MIEAKERSINVTSHPSCTLFSFRKSLSYTAWSNISPLHNTTKYSPIRQNVSKGSMQDWNKVNGMTLFGNADQSKRQENLRNHLYLPSDGITEQSTSTWLHVPKFAKMMFFYRVVNSNCFILGINKHFYQFHGLNSIYRTQNKMTTACFMFVLHLVSLIWWRGESHKNLTSGPLSISTKNLHHKLNFTVV